MSLTAVASTLRRPRRELSHEARVAVAALAGGAPAVVIALILVWSGDHSARLQWTLSIVAVGAWLAFGLAVRERVAYPLRTVSNLLAALREGDYSLRARARRDDALSEVVREINAMGQMLREQRLGAIEASALLRTVMAEIDVAVFAFDEHRRLQLVNRAAERLLGLPSERLLDRSAAELGLEPLLATGSNRTVQTTFPSGAGRWSLRLRSFRERGVPHQLLVVSDLTRELREEELKAWQRIVRVIGHELNNSLAPIKSIAASLADLVRREERPADFDDDLQQGLGVISARAEALSRFMSSYAQLAKLPQPAVGEVRVADWVHRVARLETRLPIEVSDGPDVTLEADGDQLDQLLINLVRNAAEASLEAGGGVRCGWEQEDEKLEVWIEDDGPGIANSNLFVPFFTTKPGGSGIGLVLAQKIAENHGGSLTLENRRSAKGCRARLTLPSRTPNTTPQAARSKP